VERAIEVPALAEEAHLEPDLGLELALGLEGEWWDRRGEAVQGDSAVPGGEAVDVVGEVARRAAPHLRVVQPELARGDLRREPERVAEHETRARGRIEIGIARWRERGRPVVAPRRRETEIVSIREGRAPEYAVGAVFTPARGLTGCARRVVDAEPVFGDEPAVGPGRGFTRAIPRCRGADLEVEPERPRQGALRAQQHVTVEHTILQPLHVVAARRSRARRLGGPQIGRAHV